MSRQSCFDVGDLELWGNAFNIPDEMIDYIQSLQIHTTYDLAEKFRRTPDLVRTSFYHFEYCRPDAFPRLIEGLDFLKECCFSFDMTKTTTNEDEEESDEMINIQILTNDLLDWIEQAPPLSIDFKAVFIRNAVTTLDELIEIVQTGPSHRKYYVIDQMKSSLKPVPKKKFERYFLQTTTKNTPPSIPVPQPQPVPPLLKSRTAPVAQQIPNKVNSTVSDVANLSKGEPSDSMEFIMRRSDGIRGIDKKEEKTSSCEYWKCLTCETRNESFHEKCSLCLTRHQSKVPSMSSGRRSLHKSVSVSAVHKHTFT